MHRILYIYKRLMFKVTYAPENYQWIVRDVLRVCGVSNIANDLIIHGMVWRNTAEGFLHCCTVERCGDDA